MDTTEIRIKMCEKAEEIQKVWEPQAGDTIRFQSMQDGQFYVTQVIEPFGDDEVTFGDPLYNTTNYYKCSSVVWFPHQCQLQKMVMGNTLNEEKLGSLLSRFWVFCSCKYLGELTFKVFTSMEQLWLAFVMKENHGKVWNGEDWIKDK